MAVAFLAAVLVAVFITGAVEDGERRGRRKVDDVDRRAGRPGKGHRAVGRDGLGLGRPRGSVVTW